jgi:hypothetical protein
MYMLWSQYKLVTMRCTEFLRKKITGIPNTANRNSNFLTLQTLEFQKKIRPKSPESKTKPKFRLQWGSQKSEPKIGIPNQALPSLNVVDVASIFVIAILVDDTSERSTVAFSYTSITVAITRLPPSGWRFVNETSDSNLQMIPLPSSHQHAISRNPLPKEALPPVESDEQQCALSKGGVHLREAR